MKFYFTFLIITMPWLSCISQKISDEEYNSLAKIFAKNMQYETANKDTYASNKLEKGAVFTQQKVFETGGKSALKSSTDKLLIIASYDMYTQVQSRIDRYANDINLNYGYQIVTRVVTGASHTDIKSIILSELSNLRGVVLIGDIQAAWYETPNDFNMYGYKEWPCDLYYMDTDGVWSDTDSDGIYDTHTGNIAPEVFVGRISTANMGSLLNEKEGLEQYFDKNHDFWIGKNPANRKYALSYVDEDWDDISYFGNDIQYLYGSENYDVFLKKDFPDFGMADYVERLGNPRYQFIQIALHSGPDYSRFTHSDVLFSTDIFNGGTEAIAYNLYCCEAARWTSGSSGYPNGYLAGAYVYNSNSSSLVALGSTKTGSMLYFKDYYESLAQKKCNGEAYVDWWLKVVGTVYNIDAVYWHYGMSIIGDPMVNFFHCTNSSVNNESVGGYEFYEGCDLTINNMNILPNADVDIEFINSVSFTNGFTTASGATLDIKPE